MATSNNGGAIGKHCEMIVGGVVVTLGALSVATFTLFIPFHPS